MLTFDVMQRNLHLASRQEIQFVYLGRKLKNPRTKMSRGPRKPVSGSIQTDLYIHRKRLEAWNMGFKKKRDCTICIVETEAPISFAVTAQMICAFVFT